MKKISLMFVVIIMAMLFAVSASALEPTGQCGDNVYWTFDETTGEVVISGTGGMGDSLVCYLSPFYEESDVKTVTIENGVTSIGDYAFDLCENLTTVTIPNSVSRIGDYAFGACSSLSDVTIPGSVKSIGRGAFMGTNIKELIIPEGVTTISNTAFSLCSNLESVKISSSVTDMALTVFLGCISLKNIVVSPNNINYCDIDGVLFNKNKTELIQYPIGNTKEKYIIPDGVTSVSGAAFCYSQYLKTITFPLSMTNISAEAFMFCDKLNSIIMYNNINNIGDFAFNGCNSLADIYYTGSEAQWKEVNIGMLNDGIDNAVIHYGYTIPVEPEIPDEPEVPDTPSDPADDCSCNCHKGGIGGFFFKILNFFQKLFGQNKVCACGVKH